jgi:transposase
MAKSYIPVVRDQPFLLPPDMGEWLPGEHLAWFVIDAVAALDTSAFHARRQLGGVGRRGYDPDMLLALLIYCYAQKERSSRRIERLCEVDVACRVICGNSTPDHTVIARFRAEHEDAVKALFAQVVALCVAEGMGGLGLLAIDGTKIEANASRLSNRTRKAIAAAVDEAVAQAARVDAVEDAQWGDARGDELPPRWADRTGRPERLRAALAQIDGEAAEAVADSAAATRVAEAETKVARVRAAQQAKVDAYAQAVAAGRRPPGRPPAPADEYCLTRSAREQLAAAQANLDAATRRAQRNKRGHERKANTTDPDSRLMRSKGAWVQGYNAQAAVNEHGVALAADVTNQVSDVACLHPMIHQAQRHVTAAGSSEHIGTVVADAGYWSADNVTPEDSDALKSADQPAPRLLIPPRKFKPCRDEEDPGPPPDDDATPAEKMRYQLTTPEGKAAYGRRAPLAEGPFGHLKTTLGFTRFSRRGLPAVDAEWHFILAVRNLLKIHQHQLAQATAAATTA